MNKLDQIYNASIKLFNQNGFDKTPTSQIAKEAGIAVGTLFHYFASKEQLINSLYLRCKDSLLASVLGGIDEAATYKGRFKLIYRNFVRWGEQNTDQYVFFMRFSNSVYIQEITKIESANKLSVLRVFIEEGIQQEIVRESSADYLQTIATAIFMANVEYYISVKDNISFDEFVDESFEFVWNCIKA